MQTKKLMYELYDRFEDIMLAAAVASDSMAGYIDIEGAATDAAAEANNTLRDITKHLDGIRECLNSMEAQEPA